MNNSTRHEEPNSTPTDMSGELDRGIKDDMSHDIPVSYMEDREENIGVESGGMQEVYWEESSAALEVSSELQKSNRAYWEESENIESRNAPYGAWE